ncbi:MAG: patatin-like phospholipase family protein [Planctomycetota bacterium]
MVPPLTPRLDDVALVLSGGGARAAYQVGFLSWLADRFPDLRPPILTGVSAGAINAAYLAGRTEPYADRLRNLTSMWSALETDDVFEVHPSGLFSKVARSGFSLLSGGHLLRKHGGLVDFAPLRRLLGRVLEAEDGYLPGIAKNIASGELRAVAITAASYTSGRSVTFVEGRDVKLWDRAHRTSREVRLTSEHVLASSALPVFFPPVEIEGRWFGDGGMRLTAPLSPAVHLGARRIFAISTRHIPSEAELRERDRPEGPPQLAQIAGNLVNTVFLDQFDADALRMERINELLESTPVAARRGLHPIELLVLRPSQDLGLLANEYEARLPRAFRFLARGAGTQNTRSNDLLSLVMFQNDYIQHLIELGRSDAQARATEIERFFLAPVRMHTA